MASKLDKLLKRKVALRRKKYHLALKFYISKKPYIFAYKSISSLIFIISKEKLINKAILAELKCIHKQHFPVMPLMHDLHEHVSKLAIALNDEARVLRGISILPISKRKIFLFVSKEKSRSFIKERLQRFKTKLGVEEKINNSFIERVNHHTEKMAARIPAFAEKQKELAEERRLIGRLQSLYGKALYEPDPGKARKEALAILSLINKLKKTELYGYLREDFNIIRNKAVQIAKNPKENKLASVIAGAYIISPGTFELTFAVLMARYATKYAKRRFSKKGRFRRAA